MFKLSAYFSDHGYLDSSRYAIHSGSLIIIPH